jgi:hypothetical protein
MSKLPVGPHVSHIPMSHMFPSRVSLFVTLRVRCNLGERNFESHAHQARVGIF